MRLRELAASRVRRVSATHGVAETGRVAGERKRIYRLYTDGGLTVRTQHRTEAAGQDSAGLLF